MTPRNPADRPTTEPPAHLHAHTCAYCTGDGIDRPDFVDREDFEAHMAHLHHGLPFEFPRAEAARGAAPRAEGPQAVAPKHLPVKEVQHDQPTDTPPSPDSPSDGGIRRGSALSEVRAEGGIGDEPTAATDLLPLGASQEVRLRPELGLGAAPRAEGLTAGKIASALADCPDLDGWTLHERDRMAADLVAALARLSRPSDERVPADMAEANREMDADLWNSDR